MKLAGLRLQNITCFEDLELHFTDGDTGASTDDKANKPCPWIVLLGENGTGKSTVLQLISAALLGRDSLSVIAGDIDWTGYIRSTNDVPKTGVVPANDTSGQASITLKILPEVGDVPLLTSEQETSLLPNGGRDPMGNGLLQQSPPIPGAVSAGWFACGYSPWRRTTRRGNTSGTGTFPVVSKENRAFRFGTMFGDERGLTPASDWIADLYATTLHPDKTPDDERRFQSAINALEKTLPHIKYHSVTTDRQVYFRESGFLIPLDRLSDGYRSTLVWTLDLVRRLWEAFPNSKNPLQESGVVLVDEIDLHLHPQWQREIVERTRRLFPNIQFIVATHSPFVAQDMRPEDQLIVLKRKAGGARRSVIAEQGRGFAQGWRADQILTSYLFGLSGTRNKSVLANEREYERLLDAETASDSAEEDSASEKRQRRMETLRTRLEATRSAPGETPDQRLAYAMANEVIETLTGVRVSSTEAVENLSEDEEGLFLNSPPRGSR